MKKLLCLLLTLSMLLSVCLVGMTLPASAEEGDTGTEYTAPAYAYAPGLSAWYCGSHNTRAGEDSSSPVWEDLIGGNDLPIKVDAKTHFDETGLVLDSSKQFFPRPIVDLVNGEAFTVEIRFGDFVSLGSDFNTFMNSSNDNFALFRRNSNDNLEFKWAAVAGGSRPMCDGGLAKLQNSLITVTYEVDGNVTIYVNGGRVASKPCTMEMGADDLFIGQVSNKAFRTTYKDIRFYDRCLNDAEVKRNAAVDGYLDLLDLYVSDGLAAFYSGAKNTRAGEDTSSGVWEDLAGTNDVTITLNDKNYFTAEGLHLDSVRNYFPQQVVDVVNGKEFTVEMSLGALTSRGTAYNTFINSSNDAFSLFRRISNDTLEFKFASNAAGGRPSVAKGLDLFANSTVAITYKVGGSVNVYVDGAKVSEVPCPSAMGAGDLFFGHDLTTHNFGTVYRAIRFYDRELTADEIAKNAKADGVYSASSGEDGPKMPGYVTIAQPATHIVGDLALVREIDSADELKAVAAADLKPSTVILYLNAKLQVTDADGKKIASLSDALTQLDWKIIPVFVLADAKVIDPLAAFLDDIDFHDCAVMSKDPALVSVARQKMKTVRGIIDYTEAYKDSEGLTKDECIALRKSLHTYWGTVALLPQNAARRDAVQYLYESVVNVWVKTSDTPTAAETYDAVMSGAIGVVSDDTAGLFAAATALPETTMTRVPLNIGHRGLPSSYPENTVEGSLAGYEAGANVIELDIYLTTDNQIAVMHDGNTGRTCNANLGMESSTLAELTALYVNAGYTNDQSKNSFHLPSFEEYLIAFKDKDCRLFIEIKSGNSKIVPIMRDLIEQYDMYDQCAVITFSEAQLANLRRDYPEMSGGFLCGSLMGEANPDHNMRAVMESIGKYNATLNPSYSGYGQKSLRAALMRGIAVYPWTFDANSFKDYFTWGYSGLTGNNCNAFDRYIKTVNVEAAASGTTFAIGDSTTIRLDATTYGRDVKEGVTAQIVLLDGADIVTLSDNKLTFTGAGDVSFCVLYTPKNARTQTYTLGVQPLTYHVAAPETEPDTDPVTEPVTDPVVDPATDPETTPATDPAGPDETDVPTDPADTTPGTSAGGDETQAPSADSGCSSAMSAAALLLVLAGLGICFRRKRD